MTETSPGITTEKSDAIAGFLREFTRWLATHAKAA